MQNDSAEVKLATYQAESSLIGALLLESETKKPFSEVAAILSSSDFLNEQFGRFFKAMATLDSAPNQITLARELSRTGQLKSGDLALMSISIAKCPCCIDYLVYAKSVKKYSEMRWNWASGGKGGVIV